MSLCLQLQFNELGITIAVDFFSKINKKKRMPAEMSSESVLPFLLYLMFDKTHYLFK